MSVIFKDNSAEYLREFADRAEKALETVGLHLEGEAKEELNNSPRRIDTGLLRNSITHAVSGKSAAISVYHGDRASRYGERKSAPVGYYTGTAPNDPDNAKAVYIGSNVQYAGYVHEGTRRMAPNRFLKNAITRNEGQIREYIERELKG